MRVLARLREKEITGTACESPHFLYSFLFFYVIIFVIPIKKWYINSGARVNPFLFHVPFVFFPFN